MASNPRWSAIPAGWRKVIILVGAAEVCLTAAAAWDLGHRPEHQIRGPKRLWWPGIFIQPVGPIAYLTWARR